MYPHNCFSPFAWEGHEPRVSLPDGRIIIVINLVLIFLCVQSLLPEDGGGMRMKMPEGARPRMTSGSSIAEDAVDQLQASEKLIAGKHFGCLKNCFYQTNCITGIPSHHHFNTILLFCRAERNVGGKVKAYRSNSSATWSSLCWNGSSCQRRWNNCWCLFSQKGKQAMGYKLLVYFLVKANSCLKDILKNSLFF